MGVTGPVLRASGMKWDIRKAQPYEAYDKSSLTSPSARTATPTTGTWFAWKKCASRSESFAQCVDRIEPGPIMGKVGKVLSHPRRGLSLD